MEDNSSTETQENLSTCDSIIPSLISYDSSTSSDSNNDSFPAITHLVIFKCIGAHKENISKRYW